MVVVQRVGAEHKAEVAAECECTVFDVENVVSKYEWAKEANRRVKKLEAEGKPLPKTLNEVFTSELSTFIPIVQFCLLKFSSA